MILPDGVPRPDDDGGVAAWLVWNGSRVGAVIVLVLLPVEAVFWVGLALPTPWLIGIARAVFLALAGTAFFAGGGLRIDRGICSSRPVCRNDVVPAVLFSRHMKRTGCKTELNKVRASASLITRFRM